MKRFALVCALLVACGGKQQTQTGSGTGSGSGSADVPTPAFHDSRTKIEQRRDAACEALAKRNTACAIEDAKADLAAGKVSKSQFDADTSAQVTAKLASEFDDKCKKQKLNSFQVRVYEVCMREETSCGPLQECLKHVNDAQQ